MPSTDRSHDPAMALTAARQDPASVILEGFHAVKHAVRFGADIGPVWTPDPVALAQLVTDLAPDLDGRLTIERVAPDLWGRLTRGGLPSPALAIAPRPPVDPTSLLEDPSDAPVVLLEDPTHLGNVGAVVRVAAAAGAAGVLTTGPSDPWHPSALRGGAGLQFAVPTARVADLDPVLSGEARRRHARPVVCLDERGDELRAGSVPPRALLVFGTERRGLSTDVRGAADLTLRIPMRDGVSSLNLATAVAVALYAG